VLKWLTTSTGSCSRSIYVTKRSRCEPFRRNYTRSIGSNMATQTPHLKNNVSQLAVMVAQAFSTRKPVPKRVLLPQCELFRHAPLDVGDLHAMADAGV